MITFQSIIDEARKRKEQIAKNFYQTLQLGEEHDVFTWGLVTYFDKDSENAFSFKIVSLDENALCLDWHFRVATISFYDFNDKNPLSFENVLALFEEQLKSFEETLSYAEVKLTATK